MSLLSNPNPVRLGIYQSWFSNWYENNPIYSSLIYSDIYVNEFLNGIYYKLKMPSCIPMTRSLGYQYTIIFVKAFLLKKYKFIKFKQFSIFLKILKLKHRKTLLLLKQVIFLLKKIKLFNNFIFFNKINISLIYSNNIILFDLEKKNIQFNYLKKKKTILFNNLYYKLYNKIKRRKNIKNIVNIKDIVYSNKKNILYSTNKLYFLYKKYNLSNIKKNKKMINKKINFNKNTFQYFNKYKKSNNNNIFKHLNKKNKKLYYIKNRYSTLNVVQKKINNTNFFIKKNKKIIKYIKFNLKILNRYNNKIKLNKIYNIILYKQIRKLKLYNYKLNIYNYIKNKKKKLIKKKMYRRIRHNLFFKKIRRKKKKKNNKLIKSKFTNNSNNFFILLFEWLYKFFFLFFNYLFLQTYIFFLIFKKVNFITNLFLKIKYTTLLKKLKNIIIFLNNNVHLKNILYSTNIIKYKKNIIISIIPNKFNFTYFTNSLYNYKRINSFYRANRLNKRVNKRKEYEFKYGNSNLTFHNKLFFSNSKWVKTYYYSIFNKQLILKINNTLNKYLNINILYFHKYNEYKFNRLDNPKLLSDYIKFLMKYEFKNPSILKKIVRVHSKQNKKCRTRSYYLMRKLNNLRNRIRAKFKKIVSNSKATYINKKIYIKKKKIKFKHTSIRDIKYKNYYYRYHLKKKKLKIKNYRKNKINKKLIHFLYNNQYEKNIYSKKIKFKMKKYNNNRFNNVNLIKKNIFFRRHRIHCLNTLDNWKFIFRDIAYKRYPLIGMRIECSGPSKKGRRTQTHLYNEWVDFYRLPGKMPLVTITSDIQYWQSYGLTQRASIGIKLWMYFFSPYYSQLTRKLINTSLNDNN